MFILIKRQLAGTPDDTTDSGRDDDPGLRELLDGYRAIRVRSADRWRGRRWGSSSRAPRST